MKEGCGSFEKERLKHAEIKRDVRKGKEIDLLGEMNTWRCETCSRVLLSKAGYINHIKVHEKEQKRSTYAHLPPKPQEKTCVICSKVCKSSSGLKRHMKVHKDAIPQMDAFNPVRTTSFICHVCLKPCKSAAGLNSHLRAHGRKQEEEADGKMSNEMAII